MNTNTKLVESLEVADFMRNPVWEYINDDQLGETAVRPVEQVPTQNLNGRVVGVQVQLANGTPVWAVIGNVDTANSRSTEHFLTLSVERDGQWFTLSRYHDFDYSKNGPEALARFLDLALNDVFPISYDIRRFVKGDPAALSAKIPKEPREKLTRAEIIAMALS
jgi:hypothetical protein